MAQSPGSRQEAGAELPPAQQRSQPPPPPQLPPSPYELLVEGKRFVCTECGKCCQGSGALLMFGRPQLRGCLLMSPGCPLWGARRRATCDLGSPRYPLPTLTTMPALAGEVWANDAELAAMARALGLSLQHFLSRHTKAYSRRPGFRMLKTQANGDCVFLRDGTQCAVYGARPLQCSTYPWWPELMDPGAWLLLGLRGRAVTQAGAGRRAGTAASSPAHPPPSTRSGVGGRGPGGVRGH